MPIAKNLQESIVTKAMKGAFKTQEDELRERIQTFSAKVYRSLVTEDNEKLARKLPAGFVNMTRGFNVRLKKTNETGNYNNSIWFTLLFANDVPQPACMYDGIYLDHETSKPFLKTADMLLVEQDGINNKRKALREKIKATVGQAKSVKQLLEMWPDAAEFIPADVLAPKKQLPMVLPEGLSEMLKQAKL